MKKPKRIKEVKYETETQEEIKRFIIILGVVIVLIGGIYLFTKYVIKKPKVDITETPTAGEINYSVTTIGTMLNKKDDNYYVIIYDGESKEAAKYASISSAYSQKTGALPIYFCNLDNALNKQYIASGKSNPSAKSIEELALGELTLIKVSGGKISKYLETESSINAELGL